MPTQKKTVSTAHGEVEYETVTCDSCDAEVRKADARKFIMIDDLKRRKSWHDHVEFEIYNGGYEEGWACPYCATEGPIEFPTSGRVGRVRSLFPDDPMDAALVISLLLMGAGFGIASILASL